jgi:predicted HTH domain antitoxin
MAGMELHLDEDLVQALHMIDQPVQQAARELIVIELYRRDLITSGKAAELLGMPRTQFIEYAGQLGVPYFRLTAAVVKVDADIAHAAASRRL